MPNGALWRQPWGCTNRSTGCSSVLYVGLLPRVVACCRVVVDNPVVVVSMLGTVMVPWLICIRPLLQPLLGLQARTSVWVIDEKPPAWRLLLTISCHVLVIAGLPFNCLGYCGSVLLSCLGLLHGLLLAILAMPVLGSAKLPLPAAWVVTLPKHPSRVILLFNPLPVDNLEPMQVQTLMYSCAIHVQQLFT